MSEVGRVAGAGSESEADVEEPEKSVAAKSEDEEDKAKSDEDAAGEDDEDKSEVAESQLGVAEHRQSSRILKAQGSHPEAPLKKKSCLASVDSPRGRMESKRSRTEAAEASLSGGDSALMAHLSVCADALLAEQACGKKLSEQQELRDYVTELGAGGGGATEEAASAHAVNGLGISRTWVDTAREERWSRSKYLEVIETLGDFFFHGKRAVIHCR
jgi:hypothetical protein